MNSKDPGANRTTLKVYDVSEASRLRAEAPHCAGRPSGRRGRCPRLSLSPEAAFITHLDLPADGGILTTPLQVTRSRTGPVAER